MGHRFHDFVLDPIARQLVRAGAPVDVPRRVFDLIVFLIEQRGRAVERDELIRQVWGRENVSDNQLAQTVRSARRLLGDDGAAQRLIRTVPGFGYQWAAAVDSDVAFDAMPVPDESAVGLADPAAKGPPSIGNAAPAMIVASPRRVRWPGFVALMLCAALAIAWVAGWSPSDSRDQSPARSGTHPVWIWPATVPPGPETGWARVGLMALVAERMRAHGVPVVPIELVLGQSRDPAGAAPLPSPHWRVTIDAAPAAGGWRVRLRASGTEPASTIVVEGADLLDAAAAASDQLAPRLGGHSGEPGTPDLAFEMIRHAIRVHDLDGAATQLARLPASARGGSEAALLHAKLALARGDLADAEAKLERLLAAMPEGSPRLTARALLTRVDLRMRLGRDRWDEDLDEAVQLLETSGDPRELAAAMQQRGIRQAVAGRLDTAAADFVRARRLYTDSGDALGAARANANLARLAWQSGRASDAIDQLRQSAGVFKQYGAVGNEFNTLRSIIGLELDALRWHDALASSMRARALLPQIKDPARRHLLERRHVHALIGLGRLAEADRLLDEVEAQAAASDARAVAGSALLRAEWHLARGEPAAALAPAAAALEAVPAQQLQGGDPALLQMDSRELAAAIWTWAQLELRTGSASASEAAPLDLTPSLQAIVDHPMTLFGHMARGNALAATGKHAEAETALRVALQQAEAFNGLARLRSATFALCRVLLHRQDLDEAEVLVDRLIARDPITLEQDFTTALMMLWLRHARGDRATWQRALDHAEALAGERPLPAHLKEPPAPPTTGAGHAPGGLSIGQTD